MLVLLSLSLQAISLTGGKVFLKLIFCIPIMISQLVVIIVFDSSLIHSLWDLLCCQKSLVSYWIPPYESDITVDSTFLYQSIVFIPTACIYTSCLFVSLLYPSFCTSKNSCRLHAANLKAFQTFSNRRKLFTILYIFKNLKKMVDAAEVRCLIWPIRPWRRRGCKLVRWWQKILFLCKRNRFNCNSETKQ